MKKARRAKQPVERINAVVYCRVSTEEQVQNLSLTTQQQRCIEHCTQRGWPVIRVFRDEGQSAKTDQRVEFQEMLRYCEDDRNGVGFVVVNDLSRFSRDTGIQIAVRARLHAHGVLLRSVTEPIDETSTGNLMSNIFAALNQFDNDRKSERTKTGMQEAARLGRWPFKAPLGYVNVPVTNDGPNIVPDPNSHKLVTKAFELAATGLHAKAEILRKVTSLGLKTANGKPVTPQTFQNMLVNPIYAGWTVIPDWGKWRGSWQPLVDQELFDQVQDVLAGRRPTLTSYQRNHPDFPLRQFVRCSKCGVPLTGSWSRGRKEKYPYYRCRQQKCRAVNVRRETLEENFLRWLRRWLPEAPAIAALKDTIRTVWSERKGDAQQLQAALRSKLAKVEARTATLTDRWLDGGLPDQTYQEQLARLNSEANEVRSDLANAEFEQIDLEGVLQFAERIIGNPARLWLESTLDQRQRLQRTLFPSGIEYDGEEFGTASTPLFFCLLASVADADYHLASPTGFEPVLSP